MECPHPIKQSPIELIPATPKTLPELEIQYQAAPLNMVPSVRNFDVNMPPGSQLSVGDSSYQLQSFHFHHPSEHALDNRFSPMELHFVHQDAEQQIAVLGVMLEVGTTNPVIETIWQHLPIPNESGLEASVEIDPNLLLPQNRDYFRYQGSLTNPPFDVKVEWHVLKDPVTISQDQVTEYFEWFGTNARPLQDRLDRPVHRSDQPSAS